MPTQRTGGEQDQNAMILGEMRGQLREVVHSMANLGMKVDGLTREVIGLATLASDIGALKAKVEALEAERNRTEGAHGVVGTLLKSPALGWLVGAAISAWAVLTGKVHI
jgi:hypothetical protein